MTRPDAPSVRNEDLAAYAEGRLPPGSSLRARVEQHLRENPADATRVRQYRRQDAMIREAFDPVAKETIPEHLLSGLARPPRRRWHTAAGIAAALVIGIGAGWTAGRLIPESGGQPALLGFVERIGERIARSPDTPVRSDETIDAIAGGNGPNLHAAGLELVGAASRPGIERGVFRFDYRAPGGEIIHLFVARDIAPASPTIRTRAVDGHLLAYWHLGGSTYVLGGQMGRERLIELARRVRETLDDLPKRVELDTGGSSNRATVDPAAARAALSGEIGARPGPGEQPLSPDKL
ncbi:hypothetical protein [Halofilum ochraceum]|uniref:hypothetical protein n=1 Tax=Halofilum ochraceum TaxID=1611323 RepID=UPI0008D929EA|nr:hypothetical protein [Halofilum ochraceum]